MYQYQEIKTEMGSVIKKTDANGIELWIPTDSANSDYQAYLAWLENPEAEQSTPIVVDEAETI